ncbi:MAG: aminotransferase class V-fold PLP-dependent enzyme, partial [Armatimonadetes bacterium]|nr:aminotransferase class V-fold PLP-dependent enzyme [Armatimonadota bacterium]
ARGEIVLFPSSGTGAWEATIVNTLNPGDRVLAFNVGHFSHLFAECARRHGVLVDEVDLPWDQGVPAALVQERLGGDRGHTYRAVLAVHNETSTGVTTDLRAIREAMDAVKHPALLLVDTVSSLASIDFRFDEWGVDVAVCGSQKGLMLPPGMGILCVGPKALAAGEKGGSPRYFFDWRPVIDQNAQGFYPYTPATLLLVGLREALDMLFEEGLEQVFARHHRLAEGVRRAVRTWGLRTVCENPSEASNTLTAVYVPDGASADAVLHTALRRYNLPLGVGLGRLKGKAFRIGHLGWLNELEILAAVAGVEMALTEVGVQVPLGAGVKAAQQFFLETAQARVARPVAG